MSQEHHVQQQLEAAQAQLQGQLEQQQRHIAELEAQTHRLQWIINTSPVTTYSCEVDPPYSCTYISQSIETVLGYIPDEFTAEPDFWEQRLHPDDASSVFAAIPKLFEQGKLQHDYRIRHRDGHYVWIRDELILFRDAQGLPQEVVGYLTDISEQKRLDAERTQTEQRVEQELQHIAEENGQFRETIKAQEATYRHLFDCNPQPMWVYDLETLSFLEVNDAAIAKYGYARAEFLAMTIADIRPPEDVPRLLDNVAQVDSGLNMAGIWQHCLRDGQIIQVEIVSYALEFEGRRTELVMAQDVTERLRVERALRHSEERYRLLVELAPQIVWSADMAGRHIYVSTRMGEYVGLATEQLMDFDWQFVVHPDDLGRVRDCWMEALQTGMPYETEYRMRRANGNYRWHLSQAIRIQSDQEIQWLGMATDIHDRKQAELALQDLNHSLEQKVAERTADLYRSQTEMRAILNNSPAKIYVEDLEGRYIFVNQTFLRLFNCQLEDVIGKTIHEFFPPEIADGFRTNDRLLIERGGVQQFEEVVRINGEDRCFLSNKFLLRDEQGEVYALCGMSTDITDRKAMEVDLQESRDHLQAMLAALPLHVFRVNRAGVYLDFYPADSTLEITGLDTLVGRTMTEVLPPEVAQAHLHRIEQALHTKTVQVSEQQVEVGGALLVREVRVAPCGPNEVLFVIRDITDRKQIESQLKRQLADIEAAIDGIGITQGSTFVYLNRAHLELFGYTNAEELLGQPWMVLYGAGELSRFEQEIMPALERDGNWVGEVTATRKDGTTFDQGLSLTLTEDDQIICVSEDISDRKQIEAHNQQLLRELTSFKLALDESAIVAVADAQGVIVDVNDKFCEISGYSRQELIGQTYQLVNSGYHSVYYFRDLWRTIAGGQVWRGEICNRTKAGTWYWVDNTMVPFLDREGRPERYLSIRFDITDRKQAEIELRDLTNRLTLALEAGAYGTWDWDLVHDALWDERMYEIYGLQDLGRAATYPDWRDRVHPDDLNSVEAQLQMAAQGKAVFNVEFRIWRTDGELRWIRAIASTQCDTDGNPVRIVGINYDNTERKQAEIALHNLSDRLSLALEAGQLGVWSWDLADHLFWDAALCRMYGIPEARQLTSWQDWRSQIHSDDIERIEALLQTAIEGEPYREVEFRIWRTDGELRWIQSFAQVQRDAQGVAVRMVGLNRDITALKQTELALVAYTARVEDLYNNAPCGYCSLDAEGNITGINHTALRWLDYARTEVMGQPMSQFMSADSRRIFAQRRIMLAQSSQVRPLDYEIALLGSDGGQMHVLVIETVQRDTEGNTLGSRITMTDIRQRLRAERDVQQKLIQGNLLRQVTARIRQSLDLSIIFDTACNEVRQVLQADRVAIFRFYPESNYNDGEFMAESMVGDYPSVVAIPVHDHCFGENFANLYAHGRHYAVADIESGGLANCHEDILRQFQVRANLIIPLVTGENTLWGLLCIHQCSQPRSWQTTEIDLAQQIANQLAIAINQASLYQRIQAELAVRQQAEALITRQLEQQRTLAGLIETVRKSLAVNDILSAVTQQVHTLLQCDRVIIFRLYPDGRSRIVEEAVSPEFVTLKDQHWEDEVWSEDILERYWQGRPRIVLDVMQDTWTDCLIEYSQEGQIQSKVVAPILQEPHASEQHRWVAPRGDRRLWGIIVAHACREQRVWHEPEAELLQQVANSVAIAVQQASLFEQLQQELGDRKQVELDLQRTNAELARATRLKDEFLANMSHELRTPLNAILGMTEGLQEEVFGPLTNRQRRSLTTIETSGNHLLSLINDVLNVAKIESGQFELDHAAVNVRLLCDSSLTLVKQLAHEKRLHIETRVSKSLPELYGDERRLRQMFVNLLSNAVKFTPEGGRITVTAAYTALSPEESVSNRDLFHLKPVIETARESEPEESVSNRDLFHPEGDPADTVGILALSVADTGIGISPENANKLFQPFIQIDSALNRQYQGTGLGLALVRRITEIHGGKVTLTSEIGSGSCFTVQLPIIPIPAGNVSATTPTNSIEVVAPLAPATAPLILLAEDNAANISTITAYLTAKGYSLMVAQNGLEAVNLATSANPDLIFMDIQMPHLDGLEAIRQIRQNPALANVPIVALTALAMPGDRERCLAAGADDYISKPIRLKHLAQLISTLLAKRPTE